MNIKKIVFIIIFMSFVNLIITADIKDNFNQNSMQVSVQSLIYNDLGSYYDDELAFNFSVISLFPSFEYFIRDKISLGVSAGICWTDTLSSTDTCSDNAINISLGFQGDFYIITKRMIANNNKLFPSFGTSAVCSFSPSIDGNDYINLILFPNFKLSYYVNNHIPPYIRAGLDINIPLYKTSDYEQVDIDIAEEI